MKNNKICVLIVEDNEQIRKLLALELKICGYRIDTAGDGLEALNRINAGVLDIMVLDLQLPLIDGLTVLAELRKFSKMPVIAISAHHEMGKKALELGANTFIAKPFDLEKLVKTIRGLLPG